MTEEYKKYRTTLTPLELLQDDLAEALLDWGEAEMRYNPTSWLEKRVDEIRLNIKMMKYENELTKLELLTTPAFVWNTDTIIREYTDDWNIRLDMVKKYTAKFCQHKNVIVQGTGSRSFDGDVSDDYDSYTVCLDCGAENIEIGEDNGKDISDGCEPEF